MKKMMIMMLVVFTLALMVVGCDDSADKPKDNPLTEANKGDNPPTEPEVKPEIKPNIVVSTGDAELDKILDNLNLEEKAPTLGPAYRSYAVKSYTGDCEGAWNMLAKESQDGFGKKRDAMVNQIGELKKEDIDEAIAGMKEQIKEAKNDEEKAVPEMLTVWIELYGYAKDDFKAIPDGKSFFTCLMTKAPVKKMMLDEIPKTTIIKEEIAENGESGHILFNEDGKENKMKFVKEGGEWKLAIDMNKQSPN